MKKIAFFGLGTMGMPIAQYAYQLYQAAIPFDYEDCSAIAKVDRLPD